ncbi:MAG: sigma-E processing peptidase SpoIIGA [Clostridia bacterium]|nr:sigma-E processing peptidase SpoIIGA [Clostridia bacterium]
MYVYADLLFIENAVINYLILFIGAKVAGVQYRHIFMIISAAIGGVYSVISIVYFSIPLWFSVPAKLCMSIAMVTIAYAPENLRVCIRGIIAFYICSFVFAGAVYATGNRFKFIIPTIGVAALLVLCWVRYSRSGACVQDVVELEILLHGHETIRVKALADTGCSLVDPISGNYAIVLGWELAVFDETAMRLIPYSTATDCGVLQGFRCERALIHTRNGVREIPAPVVCPVNKSLGNGRYEAIISAEACK